MFEKFNYKTLIVARETRGLSQLELSAKLGILQGTLSKIENGNLNMDKDLVKKASEVLNYPESFFYQDMEIYPPNLHYRKKADAPAKVLSCVEGVMNIYRTNIDKLLKSVDIPAISLPFYDRTNNMAPNEAARALRQYWQMPKGPVDSLVKLLEDKGIIVISMDFGTDKIDGRSMVTSTGKFIIYINKTFSGDRQRLTLAHELGHIVCHLYSPYIFDVDVEKEAMLFASEFLMPEKEIRPQLAGKLTMQKLADLKRYWKTSMQAILRWAETLEVVTKNQARYLWSQFNSLRIRVKEPIDVPVEKPTLLSEIIKAFTDQLEYTKEELAATLHLCVDDFTEKYLMPERVLRIVR